MHPGTIVITDLSPPYSATQPPHNPACFHRSTEFGVNKDLMFKCVTMFTFLFTDNLFSLEQML